LKTFDDLRCRVLYNRTTCFSNFTKRGRIFFFYFFAVIPAIPFYYLLYLTKQGNFWYMAYSEFSQTDLGVNYMMCLFIIESVIPTTLIIVLSFIAKSKFNSRIKKNQEMGLATNANKLKRDEIQFSRMTMIIMVLFSTIRLIDLSIGVAARANFFMRFVSCRNDANILLLRQLTYLLMLSSHAFNTLIYYAMNSKITEILPKR